jgi:hypothetical protein
MAQFVDLLPQLPFPNDEVTVSPIESDSGGGLELWALIVICIMLVLGTLVVAACVARCFAGRHVQLQLNRFQGLQVALGGPGPTPTPSPRMRMAAVTSGAAAPPVVASVHQPLGGATGSADTGMAPSLSAVV